MNSPREPIKDARLNDQSSGPYITPTFKSSLKKRCVHRIKRNRQKIIRRLRGLESADAKSRQDLLQDALGDIIQKETEMTGRGEAVSEPLSLEDLTYLRSFIEDMIQEEEEIKEEQVCLEFEDIESFEQAELEACVAALDLDDS